MRRGRRRSTCAGRSTPCAQSAPACSSRPTRAAAAYAQAAEIADEDVAINRAIGRNGLAIIRKIAATKRPGEPVNILTHCNAGWLATVDYGTATAPIYLAMEEGIPVHVYVDETRPRNQGASLTAWELVNHGTPHTLVVDNAGGHLMQHGLVDMVIVGTDRTTARGDVCNKIGTYLKALAAKDNGVPFYVALPSPTIDWTVDDGVKEIPIEERSADEVEVHPGPRRRRKGRAGAHLARGQPRRQPGLRRDAGAARDRPDHRARRRGGLARGTEGAVSGARLAGRPKIVLQSDRFSTSSPSGFLHAASACRPDHHRVRGHRPRARWPAACWPIMAPRSPRSSGPTRRRSAIPNRPEARTRCGAASASSRSTSRRPKAVEEALRLIAGADALIEGNRPGVMERLGLGPAECARAESEARLWPHDRLGAGGAAGAGRRPRSQLCGADRRAVADRAPGAAPIVPPTVLGDAGGALGLAFGIVSGVLSAKATGKGCVVDAAILDMVAALSGIALWARATGMLDGGRPSMFHDSPFYDAYRCADGRYVTIGALEPQFYALLLEKLGLADVDPKAQYDTAPMAGAEGALSRAVHEPAERRVAGAARGHGRLLRAGAESRRGGGPSAQRRARPLSRRRRRAARSGRGAALSAACKSLLPA